ncbi:hypothetical protein GEV33_006909 [Tenebrio molitor]|uniref:Uncharacterized protein n=1 Tax=Tenebrio molitor TaxID=7067 RepID=A0A8J6HK93_TENMO|nr:hypothetical protein GEV33_006909 [Tenebrio molitor]
MQQFDLDNFIFVKYLFNFFVSYFDNTLHGGGGGGAAHGPNSLLRHCLNKRVQNEHKSRCCQPTTGKTAGPRASARDSRRLLRLSLIETYPINEGVDDGASGRRLDRVLVTISDTIWCDVTSAICPRRRRISKPLCLQVFPYSSRRLLRLSTHLFQLISARTKDDTSGTRGCNLRGPRSTIRHLQGESSCRPVDAVQVIRFWSTVVLRSQTGESQYADTDVC